MLFYVSAKLMTVKPPQSAFEWNSITADEILFVNGSTY